jgi:hypothetical protein
MASPAALPCRPAAAPARGRRTANSDAARYPGRASVSRFNINASIGPQIVGRDPFDQAGLDR